MVGGTWQIVVQLLGIFYWLLAKHLAMLLLAFVLLLHIELPLITHLAQTMVGGTIIFIKVSSYYEFWEKNLSVIAILFQLWFIELCDCRTSLAFRLMPQGNAILDCSPIAAAGHVIPQSYVPISVSQFMDDLSAEEDVMCNRHENNLVSRFVCSSYF